MTHVSTKERSDLAFMSDAQLLQTIRAQTRVTVKAVQHLAALITEARRRRLSLAEFSTGLPARYVQVADGKLDPELLIKFCDHTALLDSIVGVSVAEQRELVKGGTVSIVEIDNATGEFKTVSKPLRELSAPQCRLVFADGKVRDPVQQRASLRQLQEANRRRVVSVSRTSVVRVVADVASGKVIVGEHKLNPDRFAAAFKALGFKIVRDL